MKHQTTESMKFKKLQRRLGISIVELVGTLELLWHAAIKNAKRGDIGRFSNEEIAIECCWQADPDLLIDALVDTGWLDRSEEHRLVIHDWHDHCPAYLKKAVVKDEGGFVTNPPTRPGSIDPGLETPSIDPGLETPSIDPGLETPLPNLTQPNLTQPPPPPDQVAAAGRICEGEEGSQVVQLLRSIGVERAVPVSRELQRAGVTLERVQDAIATYQANRSRFDGPGAVVDNLRNDCWPAPVRSPAEVEADKRRRRQQQVEKARDRQAFKLIRTGREQQLSDDQIGRRLLAALGPEAAEGWLEKPTGPAARDGPAQRTA